MRKFTLLCAAALMGAVTMKAQTITTFESNILSHPDTTFAGPLQSTDQDYTFTDGNVRFHGNVKLGYLSGFNYSNYTNPAASNSHQYISMPHAGYNGSSQYAVCYVPQEFVTYQTVPVGAKLTGNAAGHKVIGMYVTNNPYAHDYITTKYQNGDWYKLTIRGYLNGVETQNNVDFYLADFRNGASVNLDTWEWVDLTPLGNVDSLTYDVSSTDNDPMFGINTPSYFCMDNLITSDGNDVCADVINLAVQTDVNNWTATATWNSTITATGYEAVIDQTATAPSTGTLVTVTTHTANVTANATYYAHVRSICRSGYTGNWVTKSFQTPVGIYDVAGKLSARIAPNPATTVINIDAAEVVNVSVYSLDGRMIQTAPATRTVNVQSLAEGIYFLKMTSLDGSKSATIRFVKQ